MITVTCTCLESRLSTEAWAGLEQCLLRHARMTSHSSSSLQSASDRTILTGGGCESDRVARTRTPDLSGSDPMRQNLLGRDLHARLPGVVKAMEGIRLSFRASVLFLQDNNLKSGIFDFDFLPSWFGPSCTSLLCPPSPNLSSAPHQPRPQGPPREKLPMNLSSGASHAEGPGDEVVRLTACH